jgi:NAD(P)-dependent dehydrogenase (short-subunit alcohol dehydrogenase family)
MNGKLAGRSALVTGGTRGIGHAIAHRLAAEGARVTVTGTRSDGRAADGMTYLQADFTTTAGLDLAVSQVRQLSPDILINNAGINKVAPFAEIDPDDFMRIQQVNVVAPFRLAQAVLPAMRQRRWGRIVTISSIWGRISKAGRASYSASKFAVDGMNAALAAEAAADDVLCNCVAPGFIDTELTRQVLGEEGIRDLVAQVPARRLGRPEEIAAFVVWLAGPENTFISGQNICIDGGFTRV